MGRQTRNSILSTGAVPPDILQSSSPGLLEPSAESKDASDSFKPNDRSSLKRVGSVKSQKAVKKPRVSFADDLDPQLEPLGRDHIDQPDLVVGSNDPWSGFPALWPQAASIPSERHLSNDARDAQRISHETLLQARRQAKDEAANLHDAHLRQLFHMDRFNTLLWFDPDEAKADKSYVWEKFSKDYELESKVEPSLLSPTGPRSRSSRSRGGEKKEPLPLPTALTARRRKQRTISPEEIEDIKPAPKSVRPRRGQKLASPLEYSLDHMDIDVEPHINGHVTSDNGQDSDEVELLKPKKQKKTRGRPKGKRAATKARADSPTSAAESENEATKTATMANDDIEQTPEIDIAEEEEEEAVPEEAIDWTLVPSPFPPLIADADLQFPLGSQQSSLPDPTHPYQRLEPNLWTQGSLESCLSSYVTIEDVTGKDERPRDFSAQILKEARTIDRLTLYRTEGRMISSNPDRRAKETEPIRSKDGDHSTNLVQQAFELQKLMQEERKAKTAVAKKLSQALLAYFEEHGGSEEIAQIHLERILKALARSTVKEIAKRWIMAADIIRAQDEAAEREEQERKSKEHLNMILEQSTYFLSSKRGLPNRLSDDDMSDAIPEVSAAEDSDEDERSREVSRAEPPLSSAETPATIQSDDDFGEDADEMREYDDAALLREMESEDRDAAAETESDEDQGLLKDADIPIEQLLKRYNYLQGQEAEDNREDFKDATQVDFELADHASSATGAQTPQEHSVDMEFSATDNPVQEGEDLELDIAMDIDEAESSDDDAEMDALAADAEAPLDETFLQNYLQHRMQEESNPNNEHSEEAQSAQIDAVSVSAHSEASSHTSEEALKIEVPFLLRGTLRPYQKDGLDWLASLWTNGLSGILADEMGLGKTIQTISLLAWLACEKGIWGPHLIVVPTSVLLNWEMEFKKFFPGCKVLTYYGSQKERKEKRKGWNTTNAFHVVVTSYQIALIDAPIFRRKSWHYLVLDEAHQIKNFKSQRWQVLLGFNSRRRLLLTGTPLQNNLMELWSLLYFLMPAGWSNSGPFANHKEFQEWFSNPMEKAVESGDTNNEETRATVGRLHTILRPYLLRRLKADVEKQMPGKFEHVIYCRLSKRQRFLYDEFMSRAQTRETLASGNFMNIINCMMQLRKVCNHPDLFEVRPVLTSFMLAQPAARDYEVEDHLVRNRLLKRLSSVAIVQPLALNNVSEHAAEASKRLCATQQIASLLTPPPPKHADAVLNVRSLKGWRKYADWLQHNRALDHRDIMTELNDARCSAAPALSAEAVRIVAGIPLPREASKSNLEDVARLKADMVAAFHVSIQQRAETLRSAIDKFAFVTPAVRAQDMSEIALPQIKAQDLRQSFDTEAIMPFHQAATSLTIAFPDRSLIQYDCGKLQELDQLLRTFKTTGSRVLIFTQMTKVLDILEIFLSYHGHRYLRLDGSTKVEDRQMLTERFNRDNRVLAFISSTRAGGLGINLTGANCVVFYDSDWNPAMDRQCQDRCHRIGQTRDVHIYRFVCEATIEENMLRKANQKRALDRMVIGDGDFTTEFFSRIDWKDVFQETSGEQIDISVDNGPLEQSARQASGDLQEAFAAAEDEEDQEAARAAGEEIHEDLDDCLDPNAEPKRPNIEEVDQQQEIVQSNEGELAGTIDGYMLQFLRREWEEEEEEEEEEEDNESANRSQTGPVSERAESAND